MKPGLWIAAGVLLIVVDAQPRVALEPAEEEAPQEIPEETDAPYTEPAQLLIVMTVQMVNDLAHILNHLEAFLDELRAQLDANVQLISLCRSLTCYDANGEEISRSSRSGAVLQAVDTADWVFNLRGTNTNVTSSDAEDLLETLPLGRIFNSSAILMDLNVSAIIVYDTTAPDTPVPPTAAPLPVFETPLHATIELDLPHLNLSSVLALTDNFVDVVRTLLSRPLYLASVCRVAACYTTDGSPLPGSPSTPPVQGNWSFLVVVDSSPEETTNNTAQILLGGANDIASVFGGEAIFLGVKVAFPTRTATPTLTATEHIGCLCSTPTLTPSQTLTIDTPTPTITEITPTSTLTLVAGAAPVPAGPVDTPVPEGNSSNSTGTGPDDEREPVYSFDCCVYPESTPAPLPIVDDDDEGRWLGLAGWLWLLIGFLAGCLLIALLGLALRPKKKAYEANEGEEPREAGLHDGDVVTGEKRPLKALPSEDTEMEPRNQLPTFGHSTDPHNFNSYGRAGSIGAGEAVETDYMINTKSVVSIDTSGKVPIASLRNLGTSNNSITPSAPAFNGNFDTLAGSPSPQRQPYSPGYDASGIRTHGQGPLGGYPFEDNAAV